MLGHRSCKCPCRSLSVASNPIVSPFSLIYVFYERPETPSFCIVFYILALAFDDDAFLSPFIREPKDVWATNVPDHRCGTPLEWKPSMADIPLLRRAMRTSAGITTSSTKAAQFNVMNQYNIRLGKSAGLEQPFRFYALRRGAAHALNSTLRWSPESFVPSNLFC